MPDTECAHCEHVWDIHISSGDGCAAWVVTDGDIESEPCDCPGFESPTYVVERSIVHEQVIARLLNGWIPECGGHPAVQQWYKPHSSGGMPQTNRMENEHAGLIARVRRERLS